MLFLVIFFMLLKFGQISGLFEAFFFFTFIVYKRHRTIHSLLCWKVLSSKQKTKVAWSTKEKQYFASNERVAPEKENTLSTMKDRDDQNSLCHQLIAGLTAKTMQTSSGSTSDINVFDIVLILLTLKWTSCTHFGFYLPLPVVAPAPLLYWF